MKETEPKVPSNEAPTELTEKEALNLSVFSEQMISGKPLEPITDPKILREKIWEDTREAFLTEIVPNLKHFRRNSDLEAAVRSSPKGSEQRAAAELELMENYMIQLKEEESGFGTSPALSKELGYKLNCVGKSAVAASLFEDVGLQIECGTVQGHKVVIAKDAIGRLFYADPNGIIGELHPQGETKGDVRLYELSAENQADLQIPYGRVIVTSPTVGFLYSIFNNISEPVLTMHDEESKEIWEHHKDTVRLQGDGTLRDKLLPEMANAHEELEKDQGLAFVEAEQSFMGDVLQKAFGQQTTEEETRRLTRQALVEAVACQDQEVILRFLAGKVEHLPPEGFSSESRILLEHLAAALEKLKDKDDRLRNYFLRRLTKTLHPQP